MKSKISFFNATALRKNMTRFAPVWLLYTVCLLLGLVMLADSGVEYWLSANIASGIGFMSIVNFGYALLTALLLFGDLTNSRMCNALHALPLRREAWFGSNAASGLVFSLIPTAIMTVPALIASCFSAMEQGWQIPLYWLLGTNLQYIFFFGLAVLCMMLSGNRIGAAAIYGIVNFAAVLAFYMADIVYVPHLPGVITQMEPFMRYCPVAMMPTLSLVETRQVHEFLRYAPDGSENYLLRGTFTVGQGWWYLWVCAAIGMVLLVLALLLYRRRKLECAGDLLATRKLESVFLVLFALVVGSTCQLLHAAFEGYGASGSALFLWSGLVVGWFGGLMLLRRSPRVFSWRSFLGLAALAAALGLSLLVNSMDFFGITQWVPKASEVKSATVQLSYYQSVILEEPEDIADVITLHSLGAEARLGGEMTAVNRPVETQDGDATFVEIRYELKDGSTHAREYLILVDSPAGDIARKFFSRIEQVMDVYNHRNDIRSAEDLLALLDTPEQITLTNAEMELPEELLTRENTLELLKAIIADCEEGNLVQHRAFHSELVYGDGVYHYTYYNLLIRFPESTVQLDVYADSRNILAWLEKNGMAEPVKQAVEEEKSIG